MTSRKRGNERLTLDDIYEQNITISEKTSEEIKHNKEELTSEIRQIKDDLKNDIKVVKASIDNLEQNQRATCESVESVKRDVKNLRDKQSQYDKRLNAFEQSELKNFMEIAGLSENDLNDINDIKKFVCDIL
jgi:chromosome segregation ATPase